MPSKIVAQGTVLIELCLQLETPRSTACSLHCYYCSIPPSLFLVPSLYLSSSSSLISAPCDTPHTSCVWLERSLLGGHAGRPGAGMRRLLAASDSSPVPNWRYHNIPSLVIFTPQRIYLGVRMDGIEALAFSLFI